MASIDSIVRDLTEDIVSAIATTPVKVIVMGPNLKGSTPEAALRRHIIQKAKAYANVFSAEHKALISVALEHMSDGHHLTVYEMFLVKLSDLVVLIPASPGSFCELGLFSSYETASRKMLILVNNKFPQSDNYVADGPIASAKSFGATVEHVDYRDLDRAWGFVKTRVNRIRANANVARLSGAAG